MGGREGGRDNIGSGRVNVETILTLSEERPSSIMHLEITLENSIQHHSLVARKTAHSLTALEKVSAMLGLLGVCARQTAARARNTATFSIVVCPVEEAASGGLFATTLQSRRGTPQKSDESRGVMPCCACAGNARHVHCTCDKQHYTTP